MKKIIIAAIAFTMLVACGNNEKKLTVEDKAVEYNEKLLKAMENGDEIQMEKLQEEVKKWYESLSEKDQEKADKAGEEWVDKNFERLLKASNNL